MGGKKIRSSPDGAISLRPRRIAGLLKPENEWHLEITRGCVPFGGPISPRAQGWGCEVNQRWNMQNVQAVKTLIAKAKQRPEGPLTEDPSTQESHHDHGRVFHYWGNHAPKITLILLLYGSSLGGPLGARWKPRSIFAGVMSCALALKGMLFCKALNCVYWWAAWESPKGISHTSDEARQAKLSSWELSCENGFLRG